MIHNITIVDENISGVIINSFEFTPESEQIPVSELIRQRVYAEVKEQNKNFERITPGLIESILNTKKSTVQNKDVFDPEQQFYKALDAFKKNSYFIVINDRQVTDLDEIITVTPQMTVTFIKLTPLIGG